MQRQPVRYGRHSDRHNRCTTSNIMADASSSAAPVLKLRLPAAGLQVVREKVEAVEVMKHEAVPDPSPSDNENRKDNREDKETLIQSANGTGVEREKVGNLNSPTTRSPRDNELILRMSPSPERLKRKRSNTFSESPRSGKGKFKSSMAALVMYASMEDNEVEAAKLLTQMGSADKKTKLPDFLADKSPDRIKKTKEGDGMDTGNGKSTYQTRSRGSSFDALTATAAAAMGDESAEILLPLPPMPNKTPTSGGNEDAGAGAGIADRQRRTTSGRTVVPDFANFATGGVVRNLPTGTSGVSAGGRPKFKDLGGPAFESLRKASRGSSVGSAGGASGGEGRSMNVRSRAETISDGPSHTVNRMDKIGIYGPEERKARIARFLEKRRNRVWAKKVKYDVRKNFADSRLRIKGRFVKKEDEAQYLTHPEVPEGQLQASSGSQETPKARSLSTSSAGSKL